MPAPQPSSVLVVGAGIIGLGAAWQLAKRGHQVSLIDPALDPARRLEGSQPLNGSSAALGVLMARVFHRSSGRAWRLRQRSHELWPQWVEELEHRGHRLPRRNGLLLLAADENDLARQEQIASERMRMGIAMRLMAPSELEALQPQLPGPAMGGLLSPEDGQLDPNPLMQALLAESRRAGVIRVAEAAVDLERAQRWRLTLEGGQRLAADWLVLALGLGTEPLLARLGHALPLEPVLGQALELELDTDPAWNWPGSVVWRGINLVPRPDRAGGRRLWLGATLEPGQRASPDALAELRDLGGEAPGWLRHGAVVKQWQGLRCKPRGRPAPVLEEYEPGLLVVSGHYRNGVLLAPASADWLCERISGSAMEAHPIAQPQQRQTPT